MVVAINKDGIETAIKKNDDEKVIQVFENVVVSENILEDN